MSRLSVYRKFFPILFVMLFSVHSNIFSRIFINQTPGNSLINMIKKIGKSLDEVRYSIGENITDTTIIKTPGYYLLCNNIDGQITINSDNVWLNLNNYQISDSTTTNTTIVINENHKNITISNGSLKGTGTTSTTSGITIGQGSSLINIENLHILDFNHGIYFDGSSTGTIKSCKVKNCTLFENNKGIYVNYGLKNTFEKVNAKNCFEVGFELNKSAFNCFDMCKTLNIENNDPNKNVIGFLTTSGNGNLFTECVADGIITTTDCFDKKVAGFCFSGSQSEGFETESKIINGIVNAIDGTCYGNSSGILLESELKEAPISSVLTTTRCGSLLQKIDWTINKETGEYFLGLGGNVINNQSLFILKFDDPDFEVSSVINPNNDNINDLSWSPNSKYLAVATNASASQDEVFVYRFYPKASNNSDRLELLDSIGPGTTKSVIWSHDNKYIAIAFGVVIQIWEFDGYRFGDSYVAQYTALNSPLAISFSPDDNFLGVVYGTTSDNVEILKFDPSSETPLTFEAKTTSVSQNDLGTIDFSPGRCLTTYYLAIGGDVQLNSNLEVLSFNSETSLLTSLDSKELSGSSEIHSVKWSPNGKYLIIAGEEATNGDELGLYQFDPTATAGSRLVLVDTGNFTGTTIARSATWSPDEKYIVAVGEEVSDDNITLFEVSNETTKCKIENNNISNVSGGYLSFGLKGSSRSNLIIKNLCYECDENFSSGIFNVFEKGLLGKPTIIENISMPSYYNVVNENTDLHSKLDDVDDTLSILDETVNTLVANTSTIDSKLDDLALCCATVESKVDSSLEHTNSIESKIDDITKCCLSVNSKIDFIDDNLDTMDSKIDLLKDSCYTTNSNIDVVVPTPPLQTLDSKLDELEACCEVTSSKISAIEENIDLSLPNPTGNIITESTTIDTSGLYFLGNGFEGTITIDAQTVYLDMKGLELSTTSTAVLISKNSKNILIKNGFIRGGDNGIAIKGGAQLVHIENVKLVSCTNGINLDGLETATVECCKCKNCRFHSCNKGVTANYSLKSIFENCEACNCTEVGFELNNSCFTIFNQCSALNTENSDSTKKALGFLSTSGKRNLFKECIAEGTTKEIGDFGYNAVGFLLKGTSTKDGETETKIVDCIVNSTDTTLTDSCVAYGIHLDMTLRDTTMYDLAQTVTAIIAPDFEQEIDWGPVNNFIAITGNDSKLRTYYFDEQTSSITLTDEVTLDNFGQTVKWSPNGTFIAVGDRFGTAEKAYIYRFNSTTGKIETPAFDTITFGADVEDIVWSPDGKYLAISTRAANDLQVWEFDENSGFSASAIGTAALGTSLEIDFSPDGKYITASDYEGDIFYVYKFNPLDPTNALTLIDSKTIPDSGIEPFGIVWNPVACTNTYYIALTYRINRFSEHRTEVFLFDGSSISDPIGSIAHLHSPESARTYAVGWSPNGHYIFTVGLDGGANGVSKLMQFDPTLSPNSLEEIINIPGDFTSVDWSPDGKYAIASANPATGSDNSIFRLSNVCSNNVIDGNQICNTQGGLCSIGIEGASSTNLIIKNTGYENCINFSAGIFNQYKDGLNESPNLLDNISVPPYDT